VAIIGSNSSECSWRVPRLRSGTEGSNPSPPELPQSRRDLIEPLPQLGPGHHHVDLPASAARTDKPLAPTGDRVSARASSARWIGGSFGRKVSFLCPSSVCVSPCQPLVAFRKLIAPEAGLPVSRQCALLGIARSSFYYRPRPERAEELELLQRKRDRMRPEPRSGQMRNPVPPRPSP
jgi:putative transposase